LAGGINLFARFWILVVYRSIFDSILLLKSPLKGVDDGQITPTVVNVRHHSCYSEVSPVIDAMDNCHRKEEATPSNS
jgi:hypothetical protein